MRYPLFAVWILVSIIGYGTALSFDVHAQHGQQTQSITQHNHDMTADYDHCCHGSVHLLGLNTLDSFNFATASVCPPCRYTVIAVHHPPSSLFRPPRLS